MVACTNRPALFPSRESQLVAAINPPRDRESSPSRTVFDLLYDRYLPFRLYAEFMLGKSVADLGNTFDVPEHWVRERIEAMRLCIEKQVRLNLLEATAEHLG